MLNGLATFHSQRLHEALDPVGSKNAHQVVLERQIEPGNPGVALSSGAPAQLVVDASGLMAFGAKNMQTPRLDDRIVARLPVSGETLAGGFVQYLALGCQLRLQVAAEHDIGTAARHIGGNGDHTWASGLGDDFRLLLVVLGVQYFVINLMLFKRLGELFRGLDRRGTHQHGCASVDTSAHILDDGFKLLLAGQIHQIIQVIPTHGHIGRDHHTVQTVDLSEFKGLGVGGPSHTGQLVVNAKEVLEGGRGQGLTLTLDLDHLLGLNGLMQTF